MGARVNLRAKSPEVQLSTHEIHRKARPGAARIGAVLALAFSVGCPALAAASAPADEARGWETTPPIEPEDVGLFVPRALLFVPSYALKAIFWPFEQALRLTEEHRLVERVQDLLYNDARTADESFCMAIPADDAYTVYRLSTRRGRDERRAMQIHFKGGSGARILGVIRREH